MTTIPLYKENSQLDEVFLVKRGLSMEGVEYGKKVVAYSDDLSDLS